MVMALVVIVPALFWHYFGGAVTTFWSSVITTTKSFFSSASGGFWFELFGLTIAYAIVAMLAIKLIAKFNSREASDYLKDINTPALIGIVMCVITFVIACFNFGPALWLPKNFPTKPQRGVISYLFNHLLYGKNAPPASSPTTPLPWTTGTWFWWKALVFYLVTTVAYIIFVFPEDIKEIYREAKKRHEEKTDEKLTKKNAKETKPHEDGAPSFGRLLEVEFIAEVAIDIFRFLFEKFKAK